VIKTFLVLRSSNFIFESGPAAGQLLLWPGSMTPDNPKSAFRATRDKINVYPACSGDRDHNFEIHMHEKTGNFKYIRPGYLHRRQLI